MCGFASSVAFSYFACLKVSWWLFVPRLEGSVRQSEVMLVRVTVSVLNCRLVHYVCGEALATKWALVFYPAVAEFWCVACGLGLAEYVVVVLLDNVSYIGHTTVAYFYSSVVEYAV